MMTGDQIIMKDEDLIKGKIEQRLSNHDASEKYKSRGKNEEKPPHVNIGDIVYLWIDRSKSKSRDRYLVLQLDDDGYIQVQKFTGSQLRSRKYRVKLSDIYSVQPPSSKVPEVESNDDSQKTKYTIPVFTKEFRRRKPPMNQPSAYLVTDSSDEYEITLSDLIPKEDSVPVAENIPVAEEPLVIREQLQRPIRNRRPPDRLQATEGRPVRHRRPPVI